MKTKSILTAIVLTTTLATTAAIAQGTNATLVATPTSPAPAVAVNPTPTPNQVIYLPQLPSVSALTNAAAAQGVSVEQINQTSTQIMVVYRFSNGQANTICYQLLSAAGVAPAVAGTAAVAAPAQTTVIYGAPAYQGYPGYYYDPYYCPWPWFAPVAVSLGFGFHGGYGHGGYYHGGYGHGGWGFHGGGHGWR